MKVIVATLVVGGAIAFFALRRGASDGPVTFKVAKVDRGTIEQVVTATGQLNAVVTVQVGSQVSGIIQKLGADFNSQVKAGQIVAQIDPTRFKANLEQASASLKNAEAASAKARVNHDLARAEWDRAKALADKQVIGASELEGLKAKYDLARVEMLSAEAQVAQARASVGMARVDLDRTIIRSPIDGVVLQRAVDVGQTVAASLSAPTIFTIAQDLSKMEVRAAIDEADVGKLKEGLEARFTVDAYPGREFVATIFQVRSNPNVVQNVVTYDAILRVDNPDGRLRPGMTASVRVVTEKRENVLRVPNAALRFRPPAELILASTAGPGGWGEGRRPDGADGGAPVAREGMQRPGGDMMMGRPGGPPGEGGGARFAGGRPGGPGGRRGEGARSASRVYKPEGEKVSAVPFRPGIADDQFVEVLRGPLKEGDELVIEAVGGNIPAASQRPPQQNQMNRNRGPRFF
ncbi:MAG TPA: efflux RND transporter periplasmic adaptor subunit [Polyangia bacterium]